MVYGREKSTSGCLRATVLFERWRKGLMGVLVSASTLQARNPLRKKLRRNLEVKKESIPHYYDEWDAQVCVWEQAALDGWAAPSAVLSPACRVQEKQLALPPRKRQLNLSPATTWSRIPARGSWFVTVQKIIRNAWNLRGISLICLYRKIPSPFPEGKPILLKGAFLNWGISFIIKDHRSKYLNPDQGRGPWRMPGAFCGGSQ